MLKELYGTSIIKYEEKEELLEYYILNNNDEINLNDYNEIHCINTNKIGIYGIEIIKKGENSEEKSFVSDLTVNKKFAEEIIKKVKDNMVTPIHLYDVLENFL